MRVGGDAVWVVGADVEADSFPDVREEVAWWRKVKSETPTVGDDEAGDAENYAAGRKKYIGEGKGTPSAGAEG